MIYGGCGGYQSGDRESWQRLSPEAKKMARRMLQPMTGYCDKGHPMTINGDIDERGRVYYLVPKCEMCEGESVTFELWARNFMGGMLLSDDDSARVAFLSAKAAWDAATKEAKVMQDLAPIKAEIERRRAEL